MSPGSSVRRPRMFPCVGGPLDGQRAATRDFNPKIRAFRDMGNTFKAGDLIRPGGKHGHLSDEYLAYNAGSRAYAHSMVWLHTSLFAGN